VACRKGKVGGPSPSYQLVRSRIVRVFALIASAALLLALTAAASSPVHLSSIPAASGPWFDRFNSWRMSTGVPALAEDATYSQGDALHAQYMVMTGQVTHGESALYPAYYTTAGDIASQNSNIFVSWSTGTSDTQAIDWWMGAPFHAMAMMDPRLTTTGFGSYRNSSSPSPWQMAAAVNVQQGMFTTSPHYPVYFPGNLSTEPLTAFSGNESPNPQQACPGYSGLPVFVEVGANVSTAAGAHTMTGNGSPLNTCAIDSSNSTFAGSLKWHGGVIVMPQSPLQNGVTYTVAVTVNSVPYTWSFTVGPLLSNPGPPSNVSATAGDATATVTWTAPTDNGGSTITSYTVTPYIGTLAQAPKTVAAPATAAVFNGLTDGTTYWFTVAATNSSGTGAAASSNSVTPTSTVTPPARNTTVSVRQYSLPNSDGATWQDMDATNLSLSVTPAANTLAIVSANADLWTAGAGYNQDLGIWMSPSSAPGGIAAWKESGGNGGTFSPNAAMVQTVVALSANVTYSFKVRWKTNRSALGATIYAGAGPLAGGGTSPARLTVHLAPASSVATGASGLQYSLPSSDGSAWQPLDSTNLVASLSPGAASTVIVSGNADLWTANAGYNQDIAIFASVNGGADQLVAWKESGGSAGTYSPNAAFVQATYSVSGGSTYLFKLKWKANKSAMGATIFAGAGSPGSFSPTRLTAQLVPTNDVATAMRTQQYSLGSNDGATWTEIDANLRVSPSFTGVSATVLLGGNADLWTANAGYNQDLGIFVSVNGGADQLVAWKESGGFAGTFSPNAAFVESVYAMSAGSTYVFKLKWKTNQSASGATIFAGAGPIGGIYSPAGLTALIIG